MRRRQELEKTDLDGAETRAADRKEMRIKQDTVAAKKKRYAPSSNARRRSETRRKLRTRRKLSGIVAVEGTRCK